MQSSSPPPSSSFCAHSSLPADIRSHVDPNLHDVVNKLTKLREELKGIKGENLKDAVELKRWQEKVDRIERDYKSDDTPGIWKGSLKLPLGVGKIPTGQAVLNELLDDCHDAIDKLIQQLPEEEQTGISKKAEKGKETGKGKSVAWGEGEKETGEDPSKGLTAKERVVEQAKAMGATVLGMGHKTKPEEERESPVKLAQERK